MGLPLRGGVKRGGVLFSELGPAASLNAACRRTGGVEGEDIGG